MFFSMLVLCTGVTRRNVIASHLPTLIRSEPPPCVYFYGEVNKESCFKLQTALREADHEVSGSTQPVHLHIQSFGGDLLPMLSVLDCIDQMQNPLWTFIDGYAASAATVLSVYGNQRFMTSRSVALIHELRASPSGPLSEIESEMRLAKGLANEMYGIYVKKTNMNTTDLVKLLSTDTWLDARHCLKLGIVDSII